MITSKLQLFAEMGKGGRYCLESAILRLVQALKARQKAKSLKWMFLSAYLVRMELEEGTTPEGGRRGGEPPEKPIPDDSVDK
ncbi:hypothetical protein NPIL_551521 [Nephila pilipes]|uniref:Uncharacterized protein n=1 Tax=Nephila pilipes TaxID=299642 RepID=A0A8X6QMT1_NEPPI|nr:hypothetical protein NPIL_551521 [Nephila pilipes]